MMNNKLNVALIQQTANTPVQPAIEAAAKQGAKLVILQELHNAPYFCQTEDIENFRYAEAIPGPTTQALSHLAKIHQLVIVAPIFEERAKGIYHNTAVIIESDGEIAGIYRKMHIPDDPGFHEKYYFTPGDLGFQPIQTSVGKLGVLICWDQWFPEAARLMALNDADLLIYPTAIGWDPSDTEDEKARQLDAWETIQRAHAIANHLPVIACNRVGFEANPSAQTQGTQFWGSSFICGTQGEILAKASQTEANVLTTTIDLESTSTQRKIWPFFRDRRIEAYEGLLKRYL